MHLFMINLFLELSAKFLIIYDKREVLVSLFSIQLMKNYGCSLLFDELWFIFYVISFIVFFSVYLSGVISYRYSIFSDQTCCSYSVPFFFLAFDLGNIYSGIMLSLFVLSYLTTWSQFQQFSNLPDGIEI